MWNKMKTKSLACVEINTHKIKNFLWRAKMHTREKLVPLRSLVVFEPIMLSDM